MRTILQGLINFFCPVCVEVHVIGEDVGEEYEAVAIFIDIEEWCSGRV